MGRRHFKPEQIIHMLREAEIKLAGGKTTGEVCRENGKLRDELLNGEIFYPLNEAKVLIEQWRIHCNTVRPHSSLGYRPPAPQAIKSLVMPASATQQ
jgi:hypothetical protein